VVTELSRKFASQFCWTEGKLLGKRGLAPVIQMELNVVVSKMPKADGLLNPH
jgi:hypothetical protein